MLRTWLQLIVSCVFIIIIIIIVFIRTLGTTIANLYKDSTCNKITDNVTKISNPLTSISLVAHGVSFSPVQSENVNMVVTTNLIICVHFRIILLTAEIPLI